MSIQQYQRRRVRQTGDYISNLPDTIISLILSFMPTKSAVRTSILSKRWKYLWTKTPVLDFSEMPPFGDEPSFKLTLEQKSNFKCFIDRVLLHNDVTYVQRLLLDLDGEYYGFYIESWLSLLARREICEIFIKTNGLTMSKPIELPIAFLIKKKLVVLKLEGQFAIDEKVVVHLPNLETMHLQNISSLSNELMKRLLSGCPQLKVLQILYCGLTTSLDINSLSLKTFKIRIKPRVFLVMNTPNLRCFESTGDTPSIIGDLSLLVETNMLLYPIELMYDARALLRKFTGIETLRLGTDLFHGFPLDEKLPIFPNLMHLKIIKEGNMYKLLECAPNLKFLFCYFVIDVESQFESRPPLKCMSSLERVKILKFKCDSKGFGLQMLEYFLKFGLVLKELDISELRMKLQDAGEIYQKLFMLLLSSAACEFKIRKITFY